MAKYCVPVVISEGEMAEPAVAVNGFEPAKIADTCDHALPFQNPTYGVVPALNPEASSPVLY